MATSYDVNLNIGSSIGFNIVGSGLIRGLAPIQTTTLTLEGVASSPSGYNTGTRNLSIATLDDFILTPGTTSTRQLVHMTNNGNSLLTVTEILYSLNEDISPRFYFYSTATILNSSTITIPPLSTATFLLAYIAAEAGEYISYFIIESNSDSGYYKVNTRQLCQDTQNFSITPTSFSTTTNKIGQIETVTYQITPIFNNIAYPDIGIDVFGDITGSQGWSIINTGTNFITAEFNSNEINNISGTYTSNLTIRANGTSVVVVNTATVTVDLNKSKNLGGWLSPASHYNSIVGMSYDLDNDQRVLTIGVGMGGDGIPIYGSGGSPYASVENLGLGADTVIRPYPFWANVYRIPFTGSEQVYYSSDYVVKTTDDLDYSTYFGEYHAPGSMFIVTDDGYGSLTIEINHLRELSGDAATDVTLNNLTRAFYYYSGVDTLGRYEPLPVEYSVPIASNTATTNLFIGFEYNNRDKVAGINASIVDVPVQ